MDKIDVVLFKYRRERKISEEIKPMLRKMLASLLLPSTFYMLLVYQVPEAYRWLVMAIYVIFMVVWTKVIEGKWGTKNWKYKLMDLYKKRFKNDQKQLIEIIKAEGMSCQQVYNLLIKRHSRLPQRADKQSFVISIFSLVIALTGILAPPIQGIYTSSYPEYLAYIIVIMILLAPIGYGIYKFIIWQNRQYDEKKNHYEYVIELLEDYLY